MTRCLWIVLPVLTATLFGKSAFGSTYACFPVSFALTPVVNADQSVIIIWDAAEKKQHFIRKASFKSEADNLGFLVPSPTQPELEESGNEAFSDLAEITAPPSPPPSMSNPLMCFTCTASHVICSQPPPVRVLEAKRVAGFDAVVLEADSSTALADWLKAHEYAMSPEVEVWVRPYVEASWKITAMKITKDEQHKADKNVAASALRMSFKTDRPLFPYREPDSREFADKLGAKNRLLQIYFIAEAKYEGKLAGRLPWTGKAVWSNKIKASDRQKILESLRLPKNTGPGQWWLTEFEDQWQYGIAPGDLYFARNLDQKTIKKVASATGSRPMDLSIFVIAVAVVSPSLCRRLRRLRRRD